MIARLVLQQKGKIYQSCPIHLHCKRSAKGKFSSFDPYGSLRALAVRRVEFTDCVVHLIRETSHLPARGDVC